VIPPGSFVCLPHDADYILGYVLWFDPERCDYHVCDADPEGDALSELIVPAGRIIPIATSSPARRSKATMFAVGTRVLALWPDDLGGWTSVFYAALVIAQPASSPGSYTLQFEGEVPYYADVPEKFVVPAPNP
jgi:hypothetical protein